MISGRRAVLGAGLGGFAASAAAATTMPPVPLTMATGAPGGGFALYGPSWGQRAARLSPLALSYRASGGSVANILLVEQNAAQIGLTTLAVADQAWLGQAEWTGRLKLRGFRVLCPIYQASWQVFAPLTGRMKELANLAGKRIGVGPAGGASSVLTPTLLAAAGIPARLAITGLYAEQIALLRDGKLDACAFIGITPLPVIRAAAAQGGFALLGVTIAQRNAMQRGTPGMTGAIVPRAALPHQTAAVATMGTSAIAIARADLPIALAATLTEAALTESALDEAALFGAGSKDWHSTWITGDDPVAIHPGAAPVLRRFGYAAPARLVRG